MRYYRFMSRTEFLGVINGKNMVNTKDFGARGAKTNSKGFCFLREETPTTRCYDYYDNEDNEEYYSNPYELLSVLTGIVDEGVLVGFEETPLSNLSEGWGGYSDGIYITEYSTQEYNYNTLIPVSYSVDTSDYYLGYDRMENFRDKMKKIERNFPLDYPDKRMLCIFNKLDMDWIIKNEEYLDKDCFRYLATYQELDEDFIISHLDKFDNEALIELIRYKDISDKLVKKLYELNIDEITINLMKYKEINENILLDNLNLLESSNDKGIIFSKYLEEHQASEVLLDYIIRKEKTENNFGLINYPKSLANQINSVETLDKIIDIYNSECYKDLDIRYLKMILYKEISEENKLTIDEMINSATFEEDYLLTAPFIYALDIHSNIEFLKSPENKYLWGCLKLNLQDLRDLSVSEDNLNYDFIANEQISLEDLFEYITEQKIKLNPTNLIALRGRTDILNENILKNIDNYSIEIKNILIGIHNLDKSKYLKETEPAIIKFLRGDKSYDELFENLSIQEMFSPGNVETYDASDIHYIINHFEITKSDYEYIINSINNSSLEYETKDYFLSEIDDTLFKEKELNNEMYSEYGTKILNMCLEDGQIKDSTLANIIKNIPEEKVEDMWTLIKGLKFKQKEKATEMFQYHIIENNCKLDKDLLKEIIFSSYSDSILKEKAEEIVSMFDMNISDILSKDDEKFNKLLKYISIPENSLSDNLSGLSLSQIREICNNEDLTLEDFLILRNAKLDSIDSKNVREYLDKDLIYFITDNHKNDDRLINEICNQKLNSDEIYNIFNNQHLTQEQCEKLISQLTEKKENKEITLEQENETIVKCLRKQELSPEFIERILDKRPEIISTLIRHNDLPFDVFKDNVDNIINLNVKYFEKCMINFAKNGGHEEELRNIYFEKFELVINPELIDADSIKKSFLEHKIFTEKDVVENFEIFKENVETFKMYRIPEELIREKFNLEELDRNIKFELIDNAKNYSDKFILEITKNEDSRFYTKYIDRFHEEMQKCFEQRVNLSAETENKLSNLLKIPNSYETFKNKVFISTLSYKFIENNKKVLEDLGKIEEIINKKYQYILTSNMSEDDIKFIKDNKEYLTLQNLQRALDLSSDEKNEQCKEELYQLIEKKINQDYSQHEVFAQTEEIGKEQQERAERIRKMENVVE